jgi:hypothetical protein
MEETRTPRHRFYLICIILISCGLVVSRRPDALFNPQFFAEDGAVFYQDAYNGGCWKALKTPVVGYLDTISRLTAAAAMLFPIRAAPLVFNLVAIGVQILPVWFLNTSRFDGLIPDRPTRYLLSFLYLGLPNTAEIDATITNAEWHLALLACMVILVPGSPGLRWKAFDLVVLALSGLSGPFCILLLPSAVLVWYYARRNWSLALLAVVIATSAIQVNCLVANWNSDSRQYASLGVSVVLLARIVGGQVFLGSMLGYTGLSTVYQQPWWNPGAAVPLLTALAGTAIMVYVVWKSNLTLRLFILFCALALFAALARPKYMGPGPQWPLMPPPGSSPRYYFLPMLAWATSLVWLTWSNQKPRILSVLGLGALAVMFLVGIPLDWNYPPFVDEQFSSYVAKFDQDPSGTDVSIPINPNWTMVLHKQ